MLRMVSGAGMVTMLVALSACSSEGAQEDSAATSSSASTSAPASTPPPAPPAASTESSEDQLRAAAEALDRSATARDDETAWSFYSQRCKNEIGSIEAYGQVLDAFYAVRTPNYTDWTVRVNGSSGQVVTVDADPSAPASAMNPRTWTFIDGRWQFDNC